MDHRTERPGELPGPGEAIVGGLRLPRGRLVSSDPSFAAAPPRDTKPVLWISDEPVGGAVSRMLGRGLGRVYLDLVAAFPRTGLWPLALETLRSGDGRPWLSGEFDPGSSSPIESHDPAAVLAARWSEALPIGDDDEDEDAEGGLEELAPFGRAFPGLAPAPRAPPDPAALEAVVAGARGRLGLVAVTRPADVVAAIGWSGPANHFSDMGSFSAVLRSWEDRFGAIVVGLGFDTLTLAVQRPPDTRELALAVAAEHFAMCPDNVTQGIGPLGDYADFLRGRSDWSFWWD